MVSAATPVPLLLLLLLVTVCVQPPVVEADSRGTIIVDAGKELCFYQLLTEGMPFILTYRVTFGGRSDISFRMRDPDRNIIVNGNKQRTQEFHLHAKMDGEYEICFNNKFSTVSYKKVFFSFVVGEDKVAKMDSIHVTALTAFESAVVSTHSLLEQVIEHQQFHSSSEAYDRDLAIATNERVHLWSFAEICVLVVLSVAQVVYLRGFFSNSEEVLRDRLLLCWLVCVFGGLSWAIFYTPWLTTIKTYL